MRFPPNHVTPSEMSFTRSECLSLGYSTQSFIPVELTYKRLRYWPEFSRQLAAGRIFYPTGKSHHGLYARPGTVVSSCRFSASLQLPIKLYDFIGSHRTGMASKTSANYSQRQTVRRAIVRRLADGHPAYFKSSPGRCL